MAGGADAAGLKARLKQAGDALPETLRVRIHRALSWLARAEKESRDHDARFIFLWIAFNAAYAQELGPEQAERAQLRAFLTKLVAVDGGKALHRLLFEKYTGPVRLLIENKFVFEPFWRALRTHDASNEWGMRFQHEKKAALKAVMSNETVTVLGVVFDRLYVLRNQLVHGGATWNGQVNRPQVRDGAELLHSIVPAIVALMLEHPELDLGSISFPVIGAVPRA